MVDPRVGETSHGELPGADIAEHLARHGLRVEVVSRPREGVTAGVAILRHAREVGAQLVVAGGYGHSRMRQLVFGGVTRHLFEQADVPVLFSHLVSAGQPPTPWWARPFAAGQDRKSVVEGKSGSVRVELGGRRIITKQNK